MSEGESLSELALAPCSVAVFAPSPVVTITVEAGSGNEPEIHLHAGGQGFWVARMAARLGAKVSLCVAAWWRERHGPEVTARGRGDHPCSRSRPKAPTAPTSTIDAAATRGGRRDLQPVADAA